jgi:hypothetical protein
VLERIAEHPINKIDELAALERCRPTAIAAPAGLMQHIGIPKR